MRLVIRIKSRLKLKILYLFVFSFLIEFIITMDKKYKQSYVV